MFQSFQTLNRVEMKTAPIPCFAVGQLLLEILFQIESGVLAAGDIEIFAVPVLYLGNS